VRTDKAQAWHRASARRKDEKFHPKYRTLHRQRKRTKSKLGRGLLQSMTNNMLKGSFSFSVGWPMLIQLYLDLFIGIVQAFVFTILSSVYISEALGEEE